MHLQETIKAATEHMARLYELAGGVEHDGEKGAFREYFVTQLIRPCIPPHFGIGSGIVVDSTGKQSRQSDIIIFDTRLIPPIMEIGNSGIYPIDSVISVLEVKSKIRVCHYAQIADAAFRLNPDNPNGLKIATPGKLEKERTDYPLYSVFAYESDAPQKDEFQRLKEKTGKDKDLVKLICVLKKGVWSEKHGASQSLEITVNSVKFLVYFLNRLEETAKSRGEFMLQHWLKS